MVTQLSAPEWTNVITNAETSNPNFSGISVFDDAQLSANYRTVFQRPSTNIFTAQLPPILNVDMESSVFSRSTNTYNISAYTEERDLSVSSSDIDIYWQNGYDTGRSLELDTNWFNTQTAPVDRLAGFIVGNYFTSVQIGSCGGNDRSVILSGVVVDSGEEYADASSLEHTADYGFNILDSTVNLVDTFALRCKYAGYRFIDSQVYSHGHMGAWRIYSPYWDSTNTTTIHEANTEGVGLYSDNSQIRFPTSGVELGRSMIAFSRCDVGIKLHNSFVGGGNQTTEDITLDGEGSESLIAPTIYHNVKNGVELDSSVLNLWGCWKVYSNGYDGFRAKSSLLRMTQYYVTHNFNIGIHLMDSFLEYGVQGSYPSYGSDAEFLSNVIYPAAGVATITSFHATHNNLNLKLKNSTMVPYVEAGSVETPTKLGAMNNVASWSYGSTAPGRGCNVPYMILDNSYGEFVHFFGSTMAGDGDNPGHIKGAVCQAKNGSTAKFIGTRKSSTIAIGTANESAATAGFHGTVSNLKYFQRMAAFAALDNSKIEFSGPVKIAYFGVGALAENNSVIRFGPQEETETWELSAAGNHTQVKHPFNPSWNRCKGF